jgi:hypothetical protein
MMKCNANSSKLKIPSHTYICIHVRKNKKLLIARYSKPYPNKGFLDLSGNAFATLTR